MECWDDSTCEPISTALNILMFKIFCFPESLLGRAVKMPR